MTRGAVATDRDAWGRVLAPLGVGPDTEILVYDDDRYHLQAGRVWFWLSYATDARAVGLIDGRFSSWKREGRPVSTDETRVAVRNVAGRRSDPGCWPPDRMSSRPPSYGGFQLVDVRSGDEYHGKGVARSRGSRCPEAGLDIFLQPSCPRPPRWWAEDGTFLEPAARGSLMQQAGIETDRPTILYFEGGRPARTQPSCARRLGVPVRHYVSGLNEWASDPTAPSRDLVGITWKRINPTIGNTHGPISGTHPSIARTTLAPISCRPQWRVPFAFPDSHKGNIMIDRVPRCDLVARVSRSSSCWW